MDVNNNYTVYINRYKLLKSLFVYFYVVNFKILFENHKTNAMPTWLNKNEIYIYIYISSS